MPPNRLLSKFIFAGQTVADLGSGPGYFTIQMAQIVGNQGKVYAADFDKKSIEMLQKKVEKGGYSRIIEAHATSASNLRFISDSSVDMVFASGLLCCMTDHAGAVSEMQRIMKPSGRAYLSVTKRFFRRTDPRTVVKEEWERLIRNRFELVSGGENLLSRWAIVTSSKNDPNHETSIRNTANESVDNASNCCACNCW